MKFKLLLYLGMMISYTGFSQKFCEIKVSAEPEVTIILDGVKLAKTDSGNEGFHFQKITPGKHVLKVEKSGYTRVVPVNLNPGDIMDYEVPVFVFSDSLKTPGTDTIWLPKPEEQIYVIVEEMPTFPGGDDGRLKFLAENIKYPEKAKESNIKGDVYVSYVINTDGSVSDVKVIKGIGGGCDEEAERVVKLMPPWNPGQQAGKLVRVQFAMPIRFSLN